jgi:putative transposase
VATAGGTLVATLPASLVLRDALVHIKHPQCKLARARKGSAHRAKARRRVGRAHVRVGAARTSRRHQFTAKLAKAHLVVVVEDIATAHLRHNHRLAQTTSDQGWGELARPLGSKTTRAGGTLVVADRWFPQARRARPVGAVKPKLSLAVRTYRRDVCTLVIDRDLNAAANLAARGE